MTRQALLSRTAVLGLALLALGGCATGREPAATAAAKPRTDSQQWVDRVQVTAQPDEPCPGGANYTATDCPNGFCLAGQPNGCGSSSMAVIGPEIVPDR